MIFGENFELRVHVNLHDSVSDIQTSLHAHDLFCFFFMKLYTRLEFKGLEFGKTTFFEFIYKPKTVKFSQQNFSCPKIVC
jgi:hypothetical protein